MAPDNRSIERVEMVRADGRVASRLVLKDYRVVEGGSQAFPHNLIVTGLSEDGQPLTASNYVLESLRINSGGAAPEKFNLPFDKAHTVIDEDAHSFLKHPQLEVAAPAGRH